jgi:YVTN family beta-propeller protein
MITVGKTALRTKRGGFNRVRGSIIHRSILALVALGFTLDAPKAGADPFAYVANAGADTVSVIDTADNTVADTVPVGDFPLGVAITPDGAFAYVANAAAGTVSVIDTLTNTVADTVPVGDFPLGVAITPDGAFAYVTNKFSNNVSVIDTATNSVVGAPVAVGDGPEGVAITPDGAFAYVVNLSRTVSVIDTLTNTVADTVPVGDFPVGVAITPDGAFAYVTNALSNTVSVIDTATNTVVATVIVGDFPGGVAITPDGAFVYVANSDSNSVSVIDTADNTVVATVVVIGGANAVAITPQPQSAIGKTLISGPDVDADGEIDVVVEVGQSLPTAYDFAMTYTNPDDPAVLILDTVPAEWQVTDVAANVITDGFGGGADGFGGTVAVAPANHKTDNKSATVIAWVPDAGLSSSTLSVGAETRGRPVHKAKRYAPASCGALSLNDGAQVFAVDEFGEPLRDESTGELLPPLFESGPLLLAAIKDLNGGGLVGDGSGDEDGDGRTDLEEVRDEPLSDPCNADTDGDGVEDGADQCLLTGPLADQIEDPENPGCWIDP